jgi:hypothetical protein
MTIARAAPRALLASMLAFSLALACESKPLKSPAAGEGVAGVGGACEPTSCEDLGVTCGEVDDGCGVVLRCGDTCAQGGAGGGQGPCVAVEPTGTSPRTASRARSSGYSGTDDAYAGLFELACETAGECKAACEEAGGQQAMCEVSECLPNANGGQDCLPAPVWAKLENIRFENETPEEMTQLILVPGDYHDVLLIDQFELDLPPAAMILGIALELRRAGDEGVADESVRIIKDERVGEANRALPDVWSEDLTRVTYGGPDDLWGESWTAEELNAGGLGFAFSTAYTRAAGNTRAYVDSARVTVHYEVSCE